MIVASVSVVDAQETCLSQLIDVLLTSPMKLWVKCQDMTLEFDYATKAVVREYLCVDQEVDQDRRMVNAGIDLHCQTSIVCECRANDKQMRTTDGAKTDHDPR